MKPIWFFLIVFLSMLGAFLVATGEVQRWFTDSAPSVAVFDFDKDEETEVDENILQFSYYDPERGVKSFKIRAELSQEDLNVKEKIDEIRNLTLRRGTLQIPLHDELAVDGAEKSDATTPEQVVLRFASAEWNRAEREQPDSKEPMQVVLRDGEGTTGDGFAFSFEELLFHYRAGKDGNPYEVSSSTPVSIRHPSFELRSPSGLSGRLSSDRNGDETLTFLPPITAVIDPDRAPFFRHETGDEKAETSENKERGDGSRLVITSAGPLQFKVETQGETRRTHIAFRDDVTIRSLSAEELDGAVDLHAHDTLSATRFECQLLELTFRQHERRLVPELATASWPGSRVKAYFERRDEDKTATYVADADRLEWRYRLPPSGALGGEPPDPLSGISEAVLSGRPILRGDGTEFQAERAVLRLNEERLLLDRVQGEFTLAHSGKSAEDDRAERSLPERWRLRAPEVEFFFARAESGSNRQLSHFVARSGENVAVAVESVSSAEARAVRLEAHEARYNQADRSLSFIGHRRDPFLEHGKNRISSRRIRFVATEGKEMAVFEEAVRARIIDVQGIAELRSADDETSADDKGADAEILSKELGGTARAFELLAARLEAGFDRQAGELTYLRSFGEGDESTAIRSIADDGDRTFVLDGASIEWDRLADRATVWGAPPESVGGEPTAGVARLRYDDSELSAGRVIFEGQSLLATLEDGISLRTATERGAVQLVAARAEISLLTRDERDAQGETSGLLRDLGPVKSLRAFAKDDSGIEISGASEDGKTTFSGRAESLTWDSRKLELRLDGDGWQEVIIDNENLRGPIRAREVIYDEGAHRFILRGEVSGELTQVPRRLRDGKTPQDAQTIVWKFEAGRIEAQLQRLPTGGNTLVSVHAREFIHLRNDEHGLRLLGDALDYDDASRKVHIFSPQDRPQTFFRRAGEFASADSDKDGRPVPASHSDAEPLDKELVDKIIAQEIWLVLRENPRARFGESKYLLLVELENDVKASFHPSMAGLRSPQKGKRRLFDNTDAWKLDAERLALGVDPVHRRGLKVIPWAIATGSVVFKSGDYTATADKATFEENLQRLTLEGKPAHLSGEGQTIQRERIVVRKEGDRLVFEYKETRRRSR